MKQDTIYSDNRVKIYENGIRFQNYYFPFGSKFVEFSDILSLDKKSPTLQNGKWRIWGTGSFVCWFPLDWKRPRRNSIFFLRLSSQRIRIGFTVENTERFSEVMRSKGIGIGIGIGIGDS
jgi:hypothetical protein